MLSALRKIVQPSLVVIVLALLICRAYFVHAAPALMLAAVAVLLCWAVLALSARQGSVLVSALRIAVCAAAAVFSAVRACGGPYWIDAAFVCCVCLWMCLEAVLFACRCFLVDKQWKKAVTAVVAALFILFNALLFANAISATPYIAWMQSPLQFAVANSYTAPASEHTQLKDGSRYISDVSYDSAYPNGFLDIYLSAEGDSSSPTFIFVHGGGFTWGDKLDGDPNGNPQGGGQQEYFLRLLVAGYNIVSINYAFAPAYRYPTPVLQLGEAVDFLEEQAQTLGLNMNEVILSGGSAGGHIVGQYVCAQCDAQYAAELGINRSLEPECIKAVVFASALFDCSRLYSTGDVGFDFMLYQCGRAYFGDGDFARSELAQATDVIAHVRANFPPTYLSDGNTATFTDQTEDMYQKLLSLGVEAQFTCYPREEAVLTHGFEIADSSYAQDNLEKMIAFLNRVFMRGE